jgi:dihydroneopterin aldolase
MKIALNAVDFFAHHGYYPEEQKLGARFIVDIQVDFDEPKMMSEDEIGNTVNYERLHQIAAAQMKIPRKLIETVAGGIMDDIKKDHPNLNSIIVTIKKLNPPLGHKVASSSVTLNYDKA